MNISKDEFKKIIGDTLRKSPKEEKYLSKRRC